MNLTRDYITALTGNPDTVMNWRVINDRDKGCGGRNIVGSLQEVYQQLIDYNQQGWGVFVCINAMDGQGQTLGNIHHIRTHVVDLDNVFTSNAMYMRALATQPSPHFAVQTSPNKFHIYWLVEPYQGNEYYSAVQRKLRQLYDGDKAVVDASRVLRVPGFYHNKADPIMVTMQLLSNAPRYNVQVINDSLAGVNVIENNSTRSPLGTPELAAPSLDWLKMALNLTNPNEMSYEEWMSFSAGIKQAGWSLTDEETLFSVWNEWCSQYAANDQGENRKIWNSFRNTEIGWPSIEKRSGVAPYIKFGFKNPEEFLKEAVPAEKPSLPIEDRNRSLPELLGGAECEYWFKDCIFINSTGEIFSPEGRFMKQGAFNGMYGGKNFIISNVTGKTTDEPWKAATRSTIFQIPKVDHIRFLPDRKPREVIEDKLGRRGVNIYMPIKVDARPGDVSIWIEHVRKILPNDGDRKIFLDYMAHCIKYPGFKIPWAPLIQSTEGVGKTVFFEVLQHCLGDMYVYSPKAQELVDSGSKFNAWMRAKLAIVVNEIKVDEKRELIEALKPMITDARIEVQAKGVDQQMEDNVANWFFFTNFRDAVPINVNGRRYSILYSALKNKTEMLKAGMDQTYFHQLWKWLREEGGLQFINHWFLNYPIERGGLSHNAPETSSHAEALRLSRSPLEVTLDKCIEEKLYGFRNGFVSSVMFQRHAKEDGTTKFTEYTMDQVLESRGYYDLGNVPEPIFNENGDRVFKVYGCRFDMQPGDYKQSQM